MSQPNVPVTLVEPYDPRWPSWFDRLEALLERHLEGHALAVEHVGSTAIPGMTAKPIIDIDVVIPVGRFEAVRSALEELGYRHEGDLGIPEREAFRSSGTGALEGLPKHHLYVCPETSAELRRHLAFRDFLRNSPEYVRRLSDLKWRLASEHENDKESYMDGKAAMYREILERALAC